MTIQSPLHRTLLLRDQVYQRIREDMRRGAYRPGQRLTEAGLAAELGVSRTPVREALGLLSREGLLVALQRGGFRVPALDAADVDAVFEIRGLLEPHAAAQAAMRATAAGLDGMRAAIAAEEASFEDRVSEDFLSANRAFRDHMFAMCGNARLARLIGTYEDHAQYVRWITLKDIDIRRVVLRGQRELLGGVEAGDPAATAAAMTRHLGESRKATISALGSVAAPGSGGGTGCGSRDSGRDGRCCPCVPPAGSGSR